MIFENRVGTKYLILGMLLFLFFLQACSDEDDIIAPVDPCSLSLVATAELDSLPSVIQWGHPVYPYSARRDCWEGSATASIVVNADSSICSVNIVESSGRDDVDKSVLSALNITVFAAGILDGEPVRSAFEKTIRFELANCP